MAQLRIPVRLSPKGGRGRFEGWVEGADGKRYLKVRVAAPPEDGKANEALVLLVAEALDCARSRVRIVSGLSSRMKIVEVEGDVAALGRGLEALGERE